MPATSPQPAANVYHAHRERQRCRILAAAEKLFNEHGIDRVTMADITSASGVRASTVYQYFSNKDDIVWAILGEVLEDTAARLKDKVEAATSGLSKITVLLEDMADALANDRDKVRSWRSLTRCMRGTGLPSA